MSNIKLFQTQQVRTHWDEIEEKWYFSIVDVIAILADNSRPRKYWSDLKKKLKDEGSELSENIGQLKMLAQDGKMRMTDVADTKQLLRFQENHSLPERNRPPCNGVRGRCQSSFFGCLPYPHKGSVDLVEKEHPVGSFWYPVR